MKNKGNKFVTIHTTDLEGLEPENAIQIVPYTHIMPYDENMMNPPIYPNAYNIPPTIPNIPAIMPPPPPALPAINIVVGDNNKIEEGGKGHIKGGDSIGQGMSNSDISTSDISKKSSSSGGQGQGLGGQGVGEQGGGVIDFTKGNFLIKKTG